MLVAQNDLSDPDFAESTVLVMNDLGNSAPIGLIVNRPTRVTVSELVSKIFPQYKPVAQLNGKVYFGGPVDFGTVWFLFRAATPPEHAFRAFDGVCVSADRDVLLHLLGRDKPMDGLRIFVGYSGWAPGQLQAEIARGDWKLERADAEAIFSGKSDHPWPAPPRAPKHSI